MKINYLPIVLLFSLLTSCNLPSQSTPQSVLATPSDQNGPVQIISPLNGTSQPANPISVQFAAKGGPFIEANLLVDDVPIASVVQDGASTSVSGSIPWDQPLNGAHILTVQMLTINKEISSASIQVMITGMGETPLAQPTQDTDLEAARRRVIKILFDHYGISLTNPPIGRKARQGVTTDPWTSAVYYKDWFIDVSLYSDGQEVTYAYPLNYSDPNATENFIKPGDKPIPMCRPSGLIKLLVVFVDYKNIGVSQQDAFEALSGSIAQINGKYLEASQAVGLQSPILQLQATGAYLASPPSTADKLLTPELVRTSTGYDPAQFDVLVQVDLDSSDASGMVAKLGTFGFGTSGCGALPNDINIWIAISNKEQLSQTSNDPRFRDTLGHELLHTMGYPIGITGVHEWICGDGSLSDGTDECDQNSLPTLMLGWTDTDGDGVVEILDKTPYGLQLP